MPLCYSLGPVVTRVAQFSSVVIFPVAQNSRPGGRWDVEPPRPLSLHRVVAGIHAGCKGSLEQIQALGVREL